MTDKQEAQLSEYRQDDEIDLRELFEILWAEKWLIVGITTAAAIISVVVSLLMTDIYRAEITLASADSEQGAGGLMGQLGGAAALLGVNVGSGGGGNVSTALAILQSREFIGQFINDNQLLVPLFASQWDKSEQTSVIDTDIYNPATAEWQSDNGMPKEPVAYRKFRGILSVTEPNRNTGIASVAIDWHNPVEAADWVNKLIIALNNNLRAHDISEANNAISYLRSQLESTQLVDMQRVFYQLIESQTRITMLADVREEYVFRVIDRAVAPDRKSEPKRSLIAVIGTMAGGMLALMIVFFRRMFGSN